MKETPTPSAAGAPTRFPSRGNHREPVPREPLWWWFREGGLYPVGVAPSGTTPPALVPRHRELGSMA
jgi:hypothetical protein